MVFQGIGYGRQVMGEGRRGKERKGKERKRGERKGDERCCAQLVLDLCGFTFYCFILFINPSMVCFSCFLTLNINTSRLFFLFFFSFFSVFLFSCTKYE